MELNWLEDFLCLADVGNFGRAAEARHMTQPAFSRRIRALEDWAGVTLFDRATQPVTLTAAGAQFMPAARDTLRRLAQGREDARQAEQAETATLTFAATQALSLTFFPGWLRGLDIAARLGAIRLISGSMQAGEEALLQGGAQFLLCHGHPRVANRLPPDRFLHRVLAQDHLRPVRAAGSGHSLDDAGTPALAYAEDSGLGRIVTAILAGHQAAPALRPVFISPLATVLQAMARDGRGLAWLPQSLIAEDLAAGRLEPAGPADRVIPVDIRLYRPQDRATRIAEDFWSAVQQA
jgi:DNA-binding transcriptional LysR family regulator